MTRNLLTASQAGLPGLFLRLAVDGHEKLETCGPPGTAAYVHAQRHIVHWVHPRVTVNQASFAGVPKPVFQDGRLSVLPIFEGTGEVSCPCCLEGEASGGVGECGDARGEGEKVAEEKKEVARMDLSTSDSENKSESESESEKEDGGNGMIAEKLGGSGGLQVQPPGVCKEQVLTGKPLSADGAEAAEEECAALLGTRPSSTLEGIPPGGILWEASEGQTKRQIDTDRSRGVQGGQETEGGQRKDGVLEEGERAVALAEGCDGEARNGAEPEFESDAKKSPPAIDLSTSSSEPSESRSQGGSEAESESDAEAKSLLSARKKIMLGLPPKPPRRTGLKTEKVALFAQLDSIFMGGAVVGKTVRQQALTTLTAGPVERTETVFGGSKKGGRQESREAPRRTRKKKREADDGGMGERTEKGFGKTGKEGKGVGLSPFKRRKKVVEITSSGGEAFSVDESFEVEVTPVKSDAGLPSHAGCPDDVCVQSTGGEGPGERKVPENEARLRRSADADRECEEATKVKEGNEAGVQDGVGMKNGLSGEKGDAKGEAEAGSSDESDDDGECLKQLLCPPGVKRHGTGKGRAVGEAKEALFAQLDDIFNSEGSAADARNRALERLRQPPISGALDTGTGGAGRFGFGNRGQNATEKQGGKGEEADLGVSKKGKRSRDGKKGVGSTPVVGSEGVEGGSEGGIQGKRGVSEERSGGQQAAAANEAQAEAPSLRQGAASSAGGLRLRGGGPRNFLRGGQQPEWGSGNGQREGGFPGGGITGGGFSGAAPFIGGRSGRDSRQHPGPFGGRRGPDVTPWKRRFHQSESNSEDSDTWQEEARESGMHWLLQSASVRRARKLRKGLPAGGPGRATPGGGAAAAGGAPPRPKPRVQIDSHTPSENPVFVRTKAGVLPMDEGLGVLKQTAPAGGGSLLGYLCFFGPPVNGAVLMVDCRDVSACARLKTIRFPACVRSRTGALRLMGVFHFTPADVAACEPYKEWMRSFGGHVRHVVLSAGGSDLGYRATYGTLARLNLVDDGIFPLTGNAAGKRSAGGGESDAQGSEAGPASEKLEEQVGEPERNDGGKTGKGGKDGKARGSGPGGVGLLGRVTLRGRQPGLDAPAEVDESRCLGGVDVEGIQAQVLKDQPTLAFWKAGGRLEDCEAEKGGSGGVDGGGEEEEGNKGSGIRAEESGKETEKGDGKEDRGGIERGEGRDPKTGRTQEVRGALETAAKEKTEAFALDNRTGVTRHEKAAKQGEEVAGKGGHVATSRPSGIERNATQAELMYERQLAEQAAVLAQQWHYLTPTINKAHCGIAKPQPNPDPVPSLVSKPNPEMNQISNPKSVRKAENQTAQKQGEGTSEGLRFRGPVPHVLFLGTGSAEPSKYRGGSAILLTLSPGNALLMDCGEGAAGQLFRTGGLIPSDGPETESAHARAQRVARSVRVLWVSHKHADHCLGVVGVLNMRGGGEPRLLIVGPVAVQKWLEEVSSSLSLLVSYASWSLSDEGSDESKVETSSADHYGGVRLESPCGQWFLYGSSKQVVHGQAKLFIETNLAFSVAVACTYIAVFGPTLRAISAKIFTTYSSFHCEILPDQF